MASLPEKPVLQKRFLKLRDENPDAVLNWDVEFTDLRECSPSFQQSFISAWKVRLQLLI